MHVLKSLDIQIEYDYSLKNKKTARCPEQFVGHNQQGDFYLVVFARTKTQIFYAKRAVEYQRIFNGIGVSDFKCNIPIFSGELDDGYYAVYRYFNNVREVTGAFPHESIMKYYEEKSQEYKVNQELVEQIELDFLSCWPADIHPQIRLLSEFNDFHNELFKFENIKLCFQHGDYTPNNILDVGENNIYLMDFEFSQKFQPIGFDLFDYHFATDRNYEGVPYKKLNNIKENLQNKINQMIDYKYRANVLPFNQDLVKDNDEKHWADNLIYNRPDLYDANHSHHLKISYGNEIYCVYYTVHKYKAYLSVWLRALPAAVVEASIDYIIKTHKNIMKIDVNYSLTNCKNQLSVDNNWVVFLPDSVEKVLDRLSKKSKYNFKREMRLLEEQSGALTFNEYGGEVPLNVINKYFEWKYETHGTDYGLSGEAYLDQYHVNGTMVLSAGERMAAILFYCKNEDSVYLENISYDTHLGKYSPGIILYEYFLEKMTALNAKVVFLGNGNQIYKTRFGSQEYLVYSGTIYRNKLIKQLNKIKNKINC